MIVHEVMTVRPVAVGPRTSVRAALALLARDRLTSLPVVTHDGVLVGIVSEADLIRDAVARDPRARLTLAGDAELAAADAPRSTYVEEVMTDHVLTVERSTDLAYAVDLLTSTGAKALPVVDDRHRLVGMLSRSDVVRVLARTDAELERELDAQVVALGHTDWLVDVHGGVAEVRGPLGAGERALAELAAHAVIGVTEVHVR